MTCERSRDWPDSRWQPRRLRRRRHVCVHSQHKSASLRFGQWRLHFRYLILPTQCTDAGRCQRSYMSISQSMRFVHKTSRGKSNGDKSIQLTELLRKDGVPLDGEMLPCTVQIMSCVNDQHHTSSALHYRLVLYLRHKQVLTVYIHKPLTQMATSRCSYCEGLHVHSHSHSLHRQFLFTIWSTLASNLEQAANAVTSTG